MEAPLPPSPLSGAPIITTPTTALYPESADSSPRSRQTDSFDADPRPPLQKLRLMCSYGGHIVPRPHDKALCYIGGDTRIIVIDRNFSLADLRHRISKTLLHNQPFTLKYQLPNEDLDSLISVTTDEDLENMVEESDRFNNTAASPGVDGLKNGRLRLFLFPQTPSNNIEQVLVETASTKSEDWFFNALNGKASTLSASDRCFSESSSVNCLLGLDDELLGKSAVIAKYVETQIEGSKSDGNLKTKVINHEVNSVPDSPMLETTSSFGSASSSPSLANLPPIRIHVQENPKVGIKDHFQQMSLGFPGNVNLVAAQKPEEVGGVVAATGLSGLPAVVGGEHSNIARVISDDDRSDHGGYRKVLQFPPQVRPQLPIPQFHQRQAQPPFDLASQDSVSSEGSMTNQTLSRQRQALYQDSILQAQSGNTRVSSNQPDSKPGDQNSSKIQMQPQVQESPGYALTGQYEQNQPQFHHPRQFIHAGNQYIQTGSIPITPYYPVYSTRQQNHPYQPAMDQQYPFYFVQARPAPGYNIPMQQTSYNELAPSVPSSRLQTPISTVAPHGTFTLGVNAPNTETSTGVYRMPIGPGPQLIQVPSTQHWAQNAGFAQIHHPSQSVAAANSPYSYELTDPNHAQMYYRQALPSQFAAHYQTLTTAPGVVVPDAPGQVPSDDMKQQARNLQQ